MNNDNNLAIEAKGLNKTYKRKNGHNVNALIDFDINIFDNEIGECYIRDIRSIN